MKEVQINGVGFNVDAVFSLGKDTFVNHPMHINHWPHLSSIQKHQALLEAWEIITDVFNRVAK